MILKKSFMGIPAGTELRKENDYLINSQGRPVMSAFMVEKYPELFDTGYDFLNPFKGIFK